MAHALRARRGNHWVALAMSPPRSPVPGPVLLRPEYNPLGGVGSSVRREDPCQPGMGRRETP